MLVELGQMSARRARAELQPLEVMAEACWQTASAGAPWWDGGGCCCR